MQIFLNFRYIGHIHKDMIALSLQSFSLCCVYNFPCVGHMIISRILLCKEVVCRVYRVPE